MLTANSARESLQEVLLDAVWRQWAALDSPAMEKTSAKATIDPEALILVSLGLIEEERRLWDLLSWWGRTSSSLLSVQRIKNLAGKFGETAESRLGEFAHVAYEEGNDARWKTLHRSIPSLQARPSKVEASGPVLRRSSTLMLLLRRGIGVGIKPDLLTVLIGSEGRPQDINSLSRATAFSNRAVRRAAEEMAEARLIRVVRDSPVNYATDAEAWLAVLQLDPPPPRWVPWHQVFPFVEGLMEIFSHLDREGARYTASSRLRDLMDTHAQTLRNFDHQFPDPAQHRGEEYLDRFLTYVPKFEAWLQDAV